jgi:hypothetical protein
MMAPNTPYSSSNKEGMRTLGVVLQLAIHIQISVEINILKTNMVPNYTRKVTIMDSVKKWLIFKAKTRARRRWNSIFMVKQQESKDKVVAGQSKKKPMLLQKFNFQIQDQKEVVVKI